MLARDAISMQENVNMHKGKLIYEAVDLSNQTGYQFGCLSLVLTDLPTRGP